MKTVWVVFYEGPEWNDPVEGYLDHKTANRRAKELNKMKDTTKPADTLTHDELYDRLSTYEVKPITIMDLPL